MTLPTIIENRTFEEIEVGDTASLTRTLSRDDIDLFAAMSGDVNPAHMDEAYARETVFQRVIAHGMWGGALVSTLLGTQLPGPGTIYLGQDLKFRRPVGIGDTVTVQVTVREKRERNIVVLDCRCLNQEGKEVTTGRPDLALTYLNEKAKSHVEPLAEQLEAEILVPCDVREGSRESPRAPSSASTMSASRRPISPPTTRA